MIAVWKDYQKTLSTDYHDVIKAGIDKLTEYYNRVVDIPAFRLAICL